MEKYKHSSDASTQASKEERRLKELQSIKNKLMSKNLNYTKMKKTLGQTI